MIKKYLGPFIAGHRRALQEQKGQSIVIITFAFLGLIALLGIALDLGLVYIERVKIGRTTDAAALAAVVELPYEEEAIRRAVEYIQLNGYDVGVDTQVLVRGCISTGGQFRNVDRNGALSPTAVVPLTYTNAISGFNYIPSAGRPTAIFVIDTLAYQPVNRDGGGVVTTKNKENCDTAAKIYGSANKLRVSGEVKVDMNFMQFFGFGEVPVQDVAVGENVTSLDISVVFDVSGSMDFETNCFGCWREDPDKEVDDYPFPSNGDAYPVRHDPQEVSGTQSYYVPTDTSTNGGGLCTAAPTSLVRDGYRYLVHEAEYYSRNDSAGHPQGWLFNRRNPGQGFWVLQRVERGSNKAHIRAHPYVTYSQSSVSNYPQLQGMSYDAECFDSQGQCWRTKSQSLTPIETSPGISTTVPFVEYDFKTDWSGDTSIWVRAQGGDPNYAHEWEGQSPKDLDSYSKAIFWRIDGVTLRGGNFNNLLNGPYKIAITDSDGDWSTGMNDSNWRWVKLGSQSLSSGWHTLRIYQGSTGFHLDKIVITNNNWGGVGNAFENDGDSFGGNSGTGFTQLRSTLTLNGGRGPDATKGSATREACNICNPIYGGTASSPMVNPNQCSCKKNSSDTAVASPFYPGGGSGVGCSSLDEPTNILENDLYHDVDPLRSAQEAVKSFAGRLDPRFDQIGLVAFSNDSAIRAPRVKLQCLVYAQKGHAGAGGAARCFDETTNPISYTNVILGLEAHNPEGGTNIPTGMREGLEELGLDINNPSTITPGACSNSTNVNGDGQTCDRQGAAKRILILMTDGSPNAHDSCPAAGLWRGQYGKNNRSYDCSIYYAREAANSFVTVYTIGIGAGVNIELLTAMATGMDPNPDPSDPDKGFYFEGRGGKFYRAAKPSDLDGIFEDILDNIFVRIVG